MLTAGPVAARSFVLFRTLGSPAFAERLPGPDGLLGTADDVAAVGINVSGSASYTSYSGISPAAGGAFDAFYRGSLLILDPLEAVGGEVEVTDFTIALANEQTNGPTASSRDLDLVPHDFVFRFPGPVEGRYTLETCADATPTLCLESDLDPTGFTWLHGDDPLLIPGISSELATYLASVAQQAPDDWTAIMILSFPPTTIATENSGGSWGTFFLGGTMNGTGVYYTTDEIVVPEPTQGAMSLSVILALLAVGRASGAARGPRRIRG